MSSFEIITSFLLKILFFQRVFNILANFWTGMILSSSWVKLNKKVKKRNLPSRGSNPGQEVKWFPKNDFGWISVDHRSPMIIIYRIIIAQKRFLVDSIYQFLLFVMKKELFWKLLLLLDLLPNFDRRRFSYNSKFFHYFSNMIYECLRLKGTPSRSRVLSSVPWKPITIPIWKFWAQNL